MRIIATCARLADSVRWVPIIECRMAERTEMYSVKGESYTRESVALKASSQHAELFRMSGLRPWDDVNSYQPVQV